MFKYIYCFVLFFTLETFSFSTLMIGSSFTTSFAASTASAGRKSVENFGGSKVESPAELIISGPEVKYRIKNYFQIVLKWLKYHLFS